MTEMQDSRAVVVRAVRVEEPGAREVETASAEGTRTRPNGQERS